MDYLAVAVGFYEDMPSPEYKSGGYRLESMVSLILNRFIGSDVHLLFFFSYFIGTDFFRKL
jgi:hypothetical protein